MKTAGSGVCKRKWKWDWRFSMGGSEGGGGMTPEKQSTLGSLRWPFRLQKHTWREKRQFRKIFFKTKIMLNWLSIASHICRRAMIIMCNCFSLSSMCDFESKETSFYLYLYQIDLSKLSECEVSFHHWISDTCVKGKKGARRSNDDCYSCT